MMGECWRLAPTPHAHHLLTIVKSYSAALNVNRIKARKSERASPFALCVATDEHHLHNRWKLPAQWQIAVAASAAGRQYLLARSAALLLRPS